MQFTVCPIIMIPKNTPPFIETEATIIKRAWPSNCWTDSFLPMFIQSVLLNLTFQSELLLNKKEQRYIATNEFKKKEMIFQSIKISMTKLINNNTIPVIPTPILYFLPILSLLYTTSDRGNRYCLKKQPACQSSRCSYCCCRQRSSHTAYHCKCTP